MHVTLGPSLVCIHAMVAAPILISSLLLDLDHYKCNEPSIAMDLDEHNGQPLLDGLL